MLDGYHQIQIPSAYGWEALQAVLRPGTYWINISVAADGVGLTQRKFRMSYTGTNLSLITGWEHNG
jgi:hypothetical protein